MHKPVRYALIGAQPCMAGVIRSPVAEFAALADEESAARAVDRFTIVESALLPMSKLWIQQEFQDEDGLLQLANLVQCPGDLVLTWVGGQLAHDQCSGDGAVANRSRKAEHFVPVVFDQSRVDAIGEELVERTVVLLRPADGEQPLVKHVADPRREAEAQGR